MFCDLSTPKLGSEENPYEMEEINGIWKLKELQFTDVYTDIKRKLIEKGSTMKIENQIYTERAKAGEKILELCKKINATKEVYIGDYRGFKMYLEFNMFEKVFQVVLKNIQTYRTTLGSDKIGVITRINNTLESMEKMLQNKS